MAAMDKVGMQSFRRDADYLVFWKTSAPVFTKTFFSVYKQHLKWQRSYYRIEG